MDHILADTPIRAPPTTIFPEVDIPLPYAILTAVFLAFCWNRCQQEDSWLLFCLTGMVPWLLKRARHYFSRIYDLFIFTAQKAWDHRIFLSAYILTPLLSLGVLALLTSLIFTYLDTYIPFCDPWRDSSILLIPYIPFFPFNSLLSSSLLYMCPRPGLARETTITNFNTFAQLSAITTELSDALLDYRDLHSLCEEARYGAVWLDNEMTKLAKPAITKGGKQVVRPRPQSLVNFQALLEQVGKFENSFLVNRTTALKEMRADLAQFDQDLASRDVSYVTRSHFSSWLFPKRMRSKPRSLNGFGGKPIHEDIVAYNLAQTDKYNHTLSSKIVDATLLLEEIREMKQKIELIGDNIVYVRMLGLFSGGSTGSGKTKGVVKSERQRRYFSRVTGVREVKNAEIETFERVMARLVGSSSAGGSAKSSAGLELAVFEMLPQVREARKVLKRVVGIRDPMFVNTGAGKGRGRKRKAAAVEWMDLSSTRELVARRQGNESVVWHWGPETTKQEEAELKRRILELKHGLTRQLDELSRAGGGF